MRTLVDFAIREEYSRVKALGDDLSKIGSIINLFTKSEISFDSVEPTICRLYIVEYTTFLA